MNVRSVRFRVCAAATLLASAFLISVGGLLVAVVRAELSDALDDSLRQHAATVTASIAAGLTTPAFEDTAARVVYSDGTVTTAGDPTVDVPVTVAGAKGALDGASRARTIAGPRGTLRVFTTTVLLPDGPATVHLAARRDDVTGPIGALVRALLLAIPAVVAGIAGLTWWLTGRTLQPVTAIRTELADITVSDLSRRVPEPGTGDEIDQLARTTNRTLARLEASVARQQQFVSDASHELRSPLARLRAALEVDLADPAGVDHARTVTSLLTDTVALQRLVDDLLLLSTLDARRFGPALTDVDPVDLGHLAAIEAAALRERRTVTVDTASVGWAPVRGDAPQLRRLVRNLLDNAERHAVSTVWLGVTITTGDAVRLSVRDDGPGIDTAHRERVFERFARVDEARSPGDGGVGLGLAIVRDIAERHGGTVAVGDGPGGHVVVELPVSGAGDAAGAGPYDAALEEDA